MFIFLAQATPDISVWEKYGLAGLVILALFTFIGVLIKLHYTERKEWRLDMKDIAVKQESTSTTITDKFVDLHKETLDRIMDSK